MWYDIFILLFYKMVSNKCNELAQKVCEVMQVIDYNNTPHNCTKYVIIKEQAFKNTPCGKESADWYKEKLKTYVLNMDLLNSPHKCQLVDTCINMSTLTNAEGHLPKELGGYDCTGLNNFEKLKESRQKMEECCLKNLK